MKDIQRAYRNTAVRESLAVVGEIAVEDLEATGASDFVVTTIPKGCVIMDVAVMSDTLSNDVDLKVVAENTTFTQDFTKTSDSAEVEYVDTIFTKTLEDTRVLVTGVQQFTTGRLQVMVTYIRPDVVTEMRVRAKEV